MQCSSPVTLTKGDPRTFGLQVPCGKCRACRISRSRQWATRLMHEFEYWEDSIFLTLTYDEDHVPDNGSVAKTEVQAFIKRLRKNLGKTRRIRYYAVGEYGEASGRPHYHAIIFGVAPCNACQQCARRYIGVEPSDGDCAAIAAAWQDRGMIYIGDVSYDSCRYVADYCQKQLSGPLGRAQYAERGIDPPFQLQSQSLGLQYAVDNFEQIEEDGILMHGSRMALPRYYTKKLDFDQSKLKCLAQELAQERVGKRESKHGVLGSAVGGMESRRQQEKNIAARAAIKNNRRKTI